MTLHDPESPFLDRLGTHLQRAAEDGPRRDRRRATAVLVAAALVVGLVGGLAVTRPEHAEAFSITVADGVVEVEVHAPITDPSLPVQQLQAVGVRAGFIEEPTPATLVGEITAVSLLEGEPDVRFDGSKVAYFTVRAGDKLTLHIGREAEPGEIYVATEPQPECARWRNRALSEVRGDIESAYESLRWQLFDGRVVTEISEPEAAYFVQDVLPLDATSGLVLVSLVPDALPEHRHCRPIP